MSPQLLGQKMENFFPVGPSNYDPLILHIYLALASKVESIYVLIIQLLY